MDRSKSTYLFREPKMEELNLEAQVNFPYENFRNGPTEKKKSPDEHFHSKTSTTIGVK